MHLHGEVQVHGLVGAAKCTGIEVEGENSRLDVFCLHPSIQILNEKRAKHKILLCVSRFRLFSFKVLSKLGVDR